jgi:hypothetical protein
VDQLTGNRLRDTLNLGQHFVSLSGHGDQNTCCAVLSQSTAQNLTNGYHTFIAYAASCLTADFQWPGDTISEDLLENPNGGAAAYIGYTRFGWIPIVDVYQSEFFKRLKSVRNLSLLNDSRFNHPNIGGLDNWTKFSLNLLGDPEMPVWVGRPNSTRVTHPAKISKAKQLVPVKVTTSSGVPIADAVVSFAMGDWTVSASTDARGQAYFFITAPATGSMEVIVTAQDCLPYFGTMLVEEQVVCKTAILCKADIACRAAISCKATILCKADIFCKSSILCGPKVIPCGGQIAPNFAISGCRAGIGTGWPAINQASGKDFVDILKESGVKNVKELLAKLDTSRVKKVFAKLSPANRKALTLMLKRISKE